MFLNPEHLVMLKVASVETLYMVSISTILTCLAGIPIGVVLVITRPGHILESRYFYWILGAIINVTRSIPFLIFIVFLIPFTRFVVGSGIGPSSVIVPLSLAATVFMARLTETSILEVPRGLIEAAYSVGASKWQIIWHVLLPEAKPGLIMSVIMTLITLISYSAMAGAVGGGGLGDLAIRYGYQRYQTGLMIVTIIILLVVVQIIQNLGDYLVVKVSRR